MRSAIYRIINIENGKMYIGSTKDVVDRKINHFSQLRNNVHHSIILQRAYNKLIDKNSMKFEILEKCEINDLMERENFYLNLYCKSNDYINNINKEFKKLSYNVLPFAQKGFNGPHSIVTIAKLKLCNPNRKPISVYDCNGTFLNNYNSCQDVGDKFKLSKNCVLKLCKIKQYICKTNAILIGFRDDLDFHKFVINSHKPILYKSWNNGKVYEDDEKVNFGIQLFVKDINTNKRFSFTSQRAACNYFKIQPCSLNRCLKANRPHRRGLLFSYEDIV